MSLTLNKPNIKSFLFKTPHSLQKWTETHRRWKVLYSKLPTPGQKSSWVEGQLKCIAGCKYNFCFVLKATTNVSFTRRQRQIKDDLRSKYVILKSLQVQGFKSSYRTTHKRQTSSKLLKTLVVVYYTPADQNRESRKQTVLCFSCPPRQKGALICRIWVH
jgi:hypothetical protein